MLHIRVAVSMVDAIGFCPIPRTHCARSRVDGWFDE